MNDDKEEEETIFTFLKWQNISNPGIFKVGFTGPFKLAGNLYLIASYKLQLVIPYPECLGSEVFRDYLHQISLDGTLI